jgi:O-antigen/teichoic acid export membrane protein
MALSKFFKDALFVQALNVLIKPVWILVVDRAVQNLLPPEQYVAYYSWLSFTILFVILLDVGINSYNNTKVAGDKNFLKTHFNSYLHVKAILALVYALLAIGVAYVISIPSAEVMVLTLLVVYQILVSFTQFFRSNITALGFYRSEGWLSISDRAFAIVICGLFLWVPALKNYFNISVFIAIQIAGAALTLITAGWLLRPSIKQSSVLPQKVFLTRVIKETWPYALLIALMGIYSRTDAVMLRFLAEDGTAETEAYAMGYRLLDAGSMLIAVFSGLLLPAFVPLLKQREPLFKLAHAAYGLIYILVLPGILFCVFYPNFIIDFLYPDKLNPSAYDVFVFLMSVLPAAGIIYVFGALLTAAGELRFLNLMAMITVFINVIGNVWLIRQYGSAGAAIATLVSQWVFALGCLIKSYQHFNWTLNMGKASGMMAWSVFVFLLIFAMFKFEFDWKLSLVVAYAVSLVLIFVFGPSEIENGITAILKKDPDKSSHRIAP